MRSRIIMHPCSPPRALVCAAALLACSDDTTEPVRPKTGAIRVTVSTTGVDAPGTYSVVVSGRPTAVSATGSGTTIAGVAPGEQSVRLNVPRNCHVAGDNPRPITVARGHTASVSFSVSCTAAFGSLRVTTATTGTAVDPNGYAVVLHGSTVENLGYFTQALVASTGELTIPRVPIGDQRVSLTGLAFNCHAVSTNPQTIAVAPGETVTVVFDALCVAGIAQFAFVAGTGSTQEIHISNADLTGDRALTENRFADTDPAWSPDGSRIAFTSDRDGNREIYVIAADGSSSVRLTDNPGDDNHPAWSPDGTRIAFVSTRLGGADIFVMNADGSNVVRLTSHSSADVGPAWSPDGRSIAFTSDRNGVPEVYVMDADGAAVTRLTTGSGKHPAWSPDGTMLAYAGPACLPDYPSACQPTIYVSVRMLAGRRLLAGVGDRPAWSPDGRRIAFDALYCDFYFVECTPSGVSVAMADGTDVIPTVVGHSAVWRPQPRLRAPHQTNRVAAAP